MLQISYNLSNNLKDNLAEIESLRQKIVLAILPRETETKLRWQARLTQVYFDLEITDTKFTKRELSNLLSLPLDKSIKRSSNQAEAWALKKALDYIDAFWFVTDQPVTPETILYLYKVISRKNAPAGIATKIKLLKQSLNYLQVKGDHPIIQAATAHLEVRLISPFETFNGRVARLTELLILYKNGLDFRGLLTTNEFWAENKSEYQNVLTTIQATQNMTVWLEFYTAGLIQNLTKAINAIHHANSITAYVPSSFWKLSNREKEILVMLDVPGSNITNKIVQRRFNVSQITASRDLAKLTSQNLLLKHGKGRSVFYTKG